MSKNCARIVLALLLSLLIADLANAWPRRRRSRRTYGNYTTSYQSGYSGGYSGYYGGTAQQVCQAKAQLQASRNRWFHPGGGFGNDGGWYEGVGSGGTAQAALNNCCVPGRYSAVIGSAAVQGSSGLWFACKIYR